MHRKKVFLLFVSLVLMSLFSGTASAAEDDGSLSGVADTIHGLFGFLPNIITLDKLVGEDAAAMFWARFLVWLLLFAVIYFGAGFVFKDKKNIATVVALVISLMSALLISDTIVINIFLTYGFVAGLLIWVIPVAAGFYLVTKVQFKLLKALIYLIMIFVLMSIDSSITSGFGENLVDNTWYSLFRLVLAVVMIAFLWNLLTAWMDGGGGGGTHRNTNWDWINRPDDRRRDNRRDDDNRGPTPPGPRPPGPVPQPTPPNRNTHDPPTPPNKNLNGVIVDRGPLPIMLGKGPKIPDEEKILIDLSRYFTGIRNQDGTNACSAFAASSMFEYVLHRRYNLPNQIISPLFLWYYARKVNNDHLHNEGVSGTNVMQRLFEKGCCFEDIWSFEDVSTGKFQAPPNIAAERDASTKKIVEFRSLDPKYTDQWVNELSDDNPIWIAIRTPDEWKGFYRSKLFERFGKYPATGGHHAIVVVGYHSHYPYKGGGIKAFKIRNSWDITWGENGYTWVPAETLTHEIMTGRNAPIVIKGWKKDNYGLLKKTEGGELLERIKDYALQEMKWLHGEYKYLHSLKEHIDKEDYRNANKIMSMVRRSENAANDFEKRIEKNLAELIGHVQEHSLKLLIAEIKKELTTRAKSLDEFEKYIKHGLGYLTKESLEKDKEYHKVKGDVQKIVGEAIITLRELEQELDKCLKLEEMMHKNIKH